MSFSKQFTICHHSNNLVVKPTKQELQLSYLARPGMFGGRRIKQVLHPGKYAYEPAIDRLCRPVDPGELDVTESRRKSIRLPRLIRMEMASWQQYQKLTWTAYLACTAPEISIPIDDADDANLGYYNCRLLEPGDVISLSHRSIITDFCYEDDYFDRYVVGVLGSSLIEQHEFAHVDMPLDERSGHLVIGKIDSNDQALELTAFAVRSGDSVYIPAKTVHTNDYLLGTWQTLLSSACDFPSARVRQPGDRPLRFTIERN